jgi:hypothetical protein
VLLNHFFVHAPASPGASSRALPAPESAPELLPTGALGARSPLLPMPLPFSGALLPGAPGSSREWEREREREREQAPGAREQSSAEPLGRSRMSSLSGRARPPRAPGGDATTEQSDVHVESGRRIGNDPARRARGIVTSLLSDVRR